MFGDKTNEEIRDIATQTLEGHQRAIMAHMTVEEIYRQAYDTFLLVEISNS